MTFEELVKKHTSEDGSVNYAEVQKEYDNQKAQEFETEKQKITQKNEELIGERRKDQERLVALEESLNSLKGKTASSNEDFKELYESEKQSKEKEIEAYKAKFGKLKGSALDSKITKALKDAGVKEEFIRFVKKDFMEKADLDITDEDIKAIAKIGDSSVDINEYIKNQLEKDDYQSILAAPVNSGGGASGSGSGKNTDFKNPFSKENWNVDKQQEIYLTKGKDVYNQMKEQVE